jgi:hypothetical protein
MLIAVAVFILLAAAQSAGAAGFARVGTFGASWERHALSGRSIALGAADLADAQGALAPLVTAAPRRGPDGVTAQYTFFDWTRYIDVRLLGFAAEFHGIRISVVDAEFDLDPMEIRTAYQPGGTGEYIDAKETFSTVGASVDVLPLILEGPSAWSWTVGVARRAHEMTLAETSAKAKDWEAGTTVGWGRAVRGGRLALAAGLHQRGLEKSTIVYDERHTLLPRWRDFGLCASLTRDLNDRPGAELEFKALYGTRKNLDYGENGYFGDRRYGFEVTWQDLVSLRWGRDDTGTIRNEWNYGLGLRWLEPWRHRVELRYDYTALDLSPVDANNDVHAVQVQLRF